MFPLPELVWHKTVALFLLLRLAEMQAIMEPNGKLKAVMTGSLIPMEVRTDVISMSTFMYILTRPFDRRASLIRQPDGNWHYPRTGFALNLADVSSIGFKSLPF